MYSPIESFICRVFMNPENVFFICVPLGALLLVKLEHYFHSKFFVIQIWQPKLLSGFLVTRVYVGPGPRNFSIFLSFISGGGYCVTDYEQSLVLIRFLHNLFHKNIEYSWLLSKINFMTPQFSGSKLESFSSNIFN
jgi:hypothetical protein